MVITNDINLLEPKVGEKILCDMWGNGYFREYVLTFVSKRTFRATAKITAGEITIRIRMGGVRHEFWRTLSGTLNYQYNKDE